MDVSLLLPHPTHQLTHPPTQLTNQPTNKQTTSQGAKLEDSCEGCKKLCEGESNKSQEQKYIYGKESTKGERKRKKSHWNMQFN